MIKPSYYDAVSAIVGNNKLCGGYSNGPLNKIVFVEGFNDLPTEEAIQAKLKELEADYDAKPEWWENIVGQTAQLGAKALTSYLLGV